MRTLDVLVVRSFVFAALRNIVQVFFLVGGFAYGRGALFECVVKVVPEFRWVFVKDFENVVEVVRYGRLFPCFPFTDGDS